MVDDRSELEENGRLASLEERIESIEATFDSKLEDVRERVVQVKRETDEKAATDHDHEELLDRIEQLEERQAEQGNEEAIQRLESTIEEHTQSIDAIEDKIDMLAASMVETQDNLDEFTRIKDEFDDLTQAIDDLDEEVELLATSVLEVQDRIGELNHAAAEQDALSRLSKRADEAGVDRAKCEDCGTKVRIGFLQEPACPHCEGSFVDVEAGGILRSGVLRTGTLSVDETSKSTDDDQAAEKSEFLGGDVNEQETTEAIDEETTETESEASGSVDFNFEESEIDAESESDVDTDDR